MAKQKHPRILVASDLLEGEVVFLGDAGWVRDHRLARVAHEPQDASELEVRALAEVAANHVIDPYLADVRLTASLIPEPLHYRERLRTAGPSVRVDLGKQALHGRAEP